MNTGRVGLRLRFGQQRLGGCAQQLRVHSGCHKYWLMGVLGESASRGALAAFQRLLRYLRTQPPPLILPSPLPLACTSL